MTAGSSSANSVQTPVIAIVPFFIIAYALAWGILGLFIFFPAQTTELFGELTGQHPLFYLAVWAPAIAAFAVILCTAGIEGLQRYLTRLFLWRCPWGWYLFLMIVIPLLFFGGSALKGNLSAESFFFPSLPSLCMALLLTAIKGPVEEFGWRGFALPLLQRKLAPIWAALILGLVWGFWHLPAFLLSGTQQSAWTFAPFFAGTVAVSVIVTALFNASRGSILLPAFMHFQLINPIWPDAQPYDTYFFVAAAILVVWFNRSKMLTRKDAIIEVIPSPGTIAGAFS